MPGPGLSRNLRQPSQSEPCPLSPAHASVALPCPHAGGGQGLRVLHQHLPCRPRRVRPAGDCTHASANMGATRVRTTRPRSAPTQGCPIAGLAVRPHKHSRNSPALVAASARANKGATPHRPACHAQAGSGHARKRDDTESVSLTGPFSHAHKALPTGPAVTLPPSAPHSPSAAAPPRGHDARLQRGRPPLRLPARRVLYLHLPGRWVAHTWLHADPPQLRRGACHDLMCGTFCPPAHAGPRSSAVLVSRRPQWLAPGARSSHCCSQGGRPRAVQADAEPYALAGGGPGGGTGRREQQGSCTKGAPPSKSQPNPSPLSSCVSMFALEAMPCPPLGLSSTAAASRPPCPCPSALQLAVLMKPTLRQCSDPLHNSHDPMATPTDPPCSRPAGHQPGEPCAEEPGLAPGPLLRLRRRPPTPLRWRRLAAAQRGHTAAGPQQATGAVCGSVRALTTHSAERESCTRTRSAPEAERDSTLPSPFHTSRLIMPESFLA